MLRIAVPETEQPGPAEGADEPECGFIASGGACGPSVAQGVGKEFYLPVQFVFPYYIMGGIVVCRP